VPRLELPALQLEVFDVAGLDGQVTLGRIQTPSQPADLSVDLEEVYEVFGQAHSWFRIITGQVYTPAGACV